MKLSKLAVSAAFIVGTSAFLLGQTAPNLENGWKPYGSYDGSHLDTVNLMNGNLMLHAPIVPDVPQRGSLKVSYALYGTSKDWQTVCFWNQTTQLWQCSWQKGGGSVDVKMTPATLIVHRTLDMEYTGGQGSTTSEAYGYSITSPDGSTHQLHGVVGTEDINGEATQFDSFDLSGYRLVLSGSGQYPGYFDQSTVTDRAGNQYLGTFGAPTSCGRITFAGLSAPGNHPPPFDDAPTGDRYCSQAAYATLVTDSNGNQISLYGPLNLNPTTDTLGKSPHLSTGTITNDFTGCVSSHPFASAIVEYYQDPNGVTRQIKLCAAEVPIQTAFNQPNPYNSSVMVGEAITGIAGVHYAPLVSVVLADGTHWTFDYDNYGELSYIGLPTGGSISYTWTTINFINCDYFNLTRVSRAVATRTLNDGQGHTYQTTYHWGAGSSSGVTNYVTDPGLNDTVHIFSDVRALAGFSPVCSLYETSTISYQGSKDSNNPLQRVDTAYSSAVVGADTPTGPGVGNVFATDVVTTVYPSGKVKKVHRDPDPGLGAGLPIFGNTIRELEYDWGQGQPGPLLRETDTVYQWQKVDGSGNRPYLTAHLLDLPASVVVISANAAENTKSGCPIDAGGGTASCMAETDYAYDEPIYLSTPTPAIATQHVAPPYGVRGNQTTVSRWLNTANSFISSHTYWYDTGEPSQTKDPLGHITTYSYDAAYAGAYVTQTCSPQTGSVAHCVSGTYDFNTGMLTSLTNENATTPASGNVQGDAAHTSNFAYDYMFRIVSGQAPPDPANSGARALTSFTFSAPNAFPVSVQRSKSVTNALSDSATSFFDGLGRVYKGQHTLPNGTATVDTTFDLAGHAATVSNPYFTTTDPTYGLTTNLYDGLDRATQTTKQDGSIATVKYDQSPTGVQGVCTQTTDEAGKQRRACSDALGRLVEVDEPGVVAGQTTTNYASLQADGNFVVYDPGTQLLWSSGTAGTNAGPLEVQDDGNLVLYQFKWQVGTYRAPSGATVPYDGCRVGDSLFVGQTLTEGQCLESMTGMTFALMTNGDLQIYDRQLGQVTWTAGTWGHTGGYAVMQSDGRLAIYTASNSLLWASTTAGTGANVVTLENDGRLILYSTVWSTGTSQGPSSGSIAHPSCDAGVGAGWTGVLATGSCFVSRNGRYELLMQSDGNLVLYNRSVTPMQALWSAGTALTPLSPVVAMRTLYTYDALGNLVCVEQHGDAATGTGCSSSPSNDATSPWRVRRFTYDSLGRLLTAKNPESGTITYLYDADGELLQKTSPAPNPNPPQPTQAVSYCYDELHRPTKRDYQAHTFNPPACPIVAPVVSYVYDSGDNAKGHLTSMTDQAGTATYGYDILGRLATETRSIAGINKTTAYSYHLGGSVKTLTYPSNRVVTFTPDSAGRLVSAVDGNGTNYVTSASYNPDGSLKGLLNGSTPALNNNFQYTPRLQLCRITTLTSGTLPTSCTDSQHIGNIMDRGYDFHAGNGTAGSGSDNGNVWGITNYRDANRSQAFTYDALNRLTSGWSSANTGVYSWGENYTIDAWGNLQISPMQSKAHGGAFQLSGNAQNRPAGLAYDAAGNLMSYLSATYTYDQENRLSSTAGMSYTYDGNGERVLKSNTSTGAAVKRYWSMGGNTLAEGDGSGNLTAEYIYFGGKRVARIDFPANIVHYYLSDHLGSTSIIASAVGTIEEESDYYPFGTEVVVTGGANELKFTGKRRDAESQLDYFGARYYSNAYGRFLTPDWSAKPSPVPYANASDPQSLNLYSYVGGVPTTRVDGDGHEVVLKGTKDDKAKEQERVVANASAKGEAALFKTQTGKDGKTRLTLDKKAAADFKGKHSVGYQRLVNAISSSKTATVSIAATYVDPNTGKTVDIAKVQNGGVTLAYSNGNSDVILSPNGGGGMFQRPVALQDGTYERLTPLHIVAGHELLGHALENMIGGNPSERHAVQIENQLRGEQDMKPRKE